MLKQETIEELKQVFEKPTEISEILPELTPAVEVVNMDLIRIHINAAIHPEYVKNVVVEILRNNNEPGPLTLHAETATSCRHLFYFDIINDI